MNRDSSVGEVAGYGLASIPGQGTISLYHAMKTYGVRVEIKFHELLTSSQNGGERLLRRSSFKFVLNRSQQFLSLVSLEADSISAVLCRWKRHTVVATDRTHPVPAFCFPIACSGRDVFF